MVLSEAGGALESRELPVPVPIGHEILIAVEACAVCRTDLHLIDGELPGTHYPIIPGHQVVGRIVAAGPDARLQLNARVGAAWLGWTCNACEYCKNGQENLCDSARFNGLHLNGGYADYMLADSRYVFPLSSAAAPSALAPLLCGGLIGYRCLKMAGAGPKLGIYGFGSAAHMITQLAVRQGTHVYAFTRPGDAAAAQLARDCGACWVGSSADPAPELLDAGIIFAPAGELVPKALTDVRKGGKVVCGGIHMSDIPGFPYSFLWGERSVTSVANMTRTDGTEFLEAAARAGLTAHTEIWPLHEANTALDLLRSGKITGTAVLLPDQRQARPESQPRPPRRQ